MLALIVAQSAGVLIPRIPRPTQRACQGRLLSVILLAAMHLVANYFVISGFPHLLWPLIGLLFAPSPTGCPEPGDTSLAT